jgi:type VI secretion system protein ImpH
MATAGGRDDAALREDLAQEGCRYGFFQAVRLLQRLSPEREPVGCGDDPRREAVRFRSRIDLSFPPSDLAGIRWPEPRAGEEDPAPELTVAFMGLANPASFGSLPLPYTELILERGREKDHAFRDFLDIYNHRLVALFYRAWEKYNFAVAYERGQEERTGAFEDALYCLLGLGMPALRRRLPCDDRALLARAHALRPGPASALALVELLESYFAVPVQIEQFVPAWYVMEDEERSRLGGRACELGRNLNLGARVQVGQSRFRVRLGPLGWSEFRDLLPAGTAFGPLVELVRLATGPEFDCDVQLVLKSEVVPPLRLGVADEQGAPYLGWSTWLHRAGRMQDAADVIIDAEAAYGTDWSGPAKSEQGGEP